jgi:YgiT-type zinc finger domain-containing protein
MSTVARCPTCGRKSMRHVVRDVATRIGTRLVTVCGIRIEECSACGERLYDLEALTQIREDRKSIKRKRVA